MMTEWWEQLRGAPGSFRFIVQPLVAILLGIRDGRRDAREGHRPYVIGLWEAKGHRRHELRLLWKQIAVPFVVAVVLDSALQYVVMQQVFFRTALVIGTLLIALPYIAARGMANRLSRGSRIQNKARKGEG